MASKKGGRVVLRGRFKAGARVRLVKVAGEHVLRAQGGVEVGVARVDESGCVAFSKGVEVGARYFIVGTIDGQPVEVRMTGRDPDADDGGQVAQAPVGRERQRLADGSFQDEAPERQDAPGPGTAPGPAQHHVPDGVVQRSATARGIATPVDVGETLPYSRQEDVPDGVMQMSSTETGIATPIVSGPPVRQDEAPAGLLQRSDTPEGVTAPIPAGDAVAAQLAKDAAAAKGTHGEPGKVAAHPADATTGVGGDELAKRRRARSTSAKKPAGRKRAARKPALSRKAAQKKTSSSGSKTTARKSAATTAKKEA